MEDATSLKDLVGSCVDDAVSRGSTYADCRALLRESEDIIVKNDKVDALTSKVSTGFGVRVLVRGAWGFSSTAGLDSDDVEEVVSEAVSIARASASLKTEDIDLVRVPAYQDSFRTPLDEDPRDVSLEEKLSLLSDAQKEMEVDESIRVRQASYDYFRERKFFQSSEGSEIEQEIVNVGAGVSATAVENGEVQRRSYPSSFGGNYRAAGWEFVEDLDLIGHSAKAAEEARDLLSAEKCPEGETDVILNTNQMALQIHESCGHPTELDRVLGSEASYAGTSFLTTDKLGDFRYGSDRVTILTDGTTPGGLGTYGYDDEGVKATKSPLVEDGLFVGYQTSRQAAKGMGVGVTGNMRADGWSRIPLIRMTNINLLPGEWGFGELVEETEEGLLLDNNKSWSIDDRRLNFQFATEVGWTIEDGELDKMVKNPSYTGITYEFWRRCDAVCGEDSWVLWGLPNCGKGEPGQTARVGHGTSPARFTDVRVGVAG